jgi:hypothetical protein
MFHDLYMFIYAFLQLPYVNKFILIQLIQVNLFVDAMIQILNRGWDLRYYGRSRLNSVERPQSQLCYNRRDKKNLNITTEIMDVSYDCGMEKHSLHKFCLG